MDAGDQEPLLARICLIFCNGRDVARFKNLAGLGPRRTLRRC